MLVTKGSIHDSRQTIENFVINQKKYNPNYRVIDIGGCVNGWTQSFVDLVVDINAKDSYKNLRLDICLDSSWEKLKDFVENNGKFDYCICTHTLEDIYNPISALNYMPQIAHRGIITVPYCKMELSYCESINYLGYIHHRWIFHKENNNILLIPKLNILDHLVKIPFITNHQEIRFYWKEKIDYSIFMQNYLGPDVKNVINQYEKFLDSISNKDTD